MGNGDADGNAKLTQMLQLIEHEREMVEIAVCCCSEHVQNCTEVVSVVCVADAHAPEPTVVVTLEDTHVAYWAVMGARGAVTQTALTVRPIRIFRHTQRRQIADNSATNHHINVRQRAGVQEDDKCDVGGRAPRGSAVCVGVVIRHNVKNFVPKSQLGAN